MCVCACVRGSRKQKRLPANGEKRHNHITSTLYSRLFVSSVV